MTLDTASIFKLRQDTCRCGWLPTSAIPALCEALPMFHHPDSDTGKQVRAGSRQTGRKAHHRSSAVGLQRKGSKFGSLQVCLRDRPIYQSRRSDGQGQQWTVRGRPCMHDRIQDDRKERDQTLDIISKNNWVEVLNDQRPRGWERKCGVAPAHAFGHFMV